MTRPVATPVAKRGLDYSSPEIRYIVLRMIPVVLSGGSGTRLWPVSRASYPKQFCEFYDRSFLQTTIDRAKKIATPYLLTVKSMQGLTFRMAHQQNIPNENILLEPMARNTAPAVALLCHV